MSFSTEWEEVYKNQNHLSIWPWSDVVSYVKRYSNPTDNNFRVLELGCGAGANIPFFKSLGVEYHAMDGSQTIVDKLHLQFPEFKKTIKVGDFTKTKFMESYYDLIIDRAALTHNDTEAIENCIFNIHSALKVGGKFVGIDWFSTVHADFSKGEEIKGDFYTKKDIKEGQFIGLGNVHFSDKEHLLNLFSGFKVLVLEHKVNELEFPKKHKFASWNIVVEK